MLAKFPTYVATDSLAMITRAEQMITHLKDICHTDVVTKDGSLVLGGTFSVLHFDTPFKNIMA